MLHVNVVERVEPKISHHMGNFFHFSFYLYEMMNVNKADCGGHFMWYNVSNYHIIHFRYIDLNVNYTSVYLSKVEK